jgi:hypothetical protein
MNSCICSRNIKLSIQDFKLTFNDHYSFKRCKAQEFI